MKIAVIGSKGLPPRQGGIEHHCAALYPKMAEKGHVIDCFARSSYIDSSLGRQYEYKGVNVISQPSFHNSRMDAFVNSAMSTMFAGSKYDIVHFHALGPSIFSWLPKLKSASTKVVVTCHGIDWQRDKWGRFSSAVIRAGEKAAAQFADQIIVVSENLKDYFKDKYGRETVYIPNAPADYVDSDESFAHVHSLGLTPKKYVLFLGRLVPEKCPDLLIRSFQNIQAEGWKLAIVGGNSDTNAYTESLFSVAKNDPNIVFTGEMKGAFLAEIVRGSGLFVLPSNLEGMPLSMLEAMMEGIPVVASDIEPHQKLLGDNRGLLFKAGNLTDSSKSLRWAIENSVQMNLMAKKAQEYAKVHHSWEKITNETLRTYSQALNFSSGLSSSEQYVP
ncbi:glycoside hydrolase [filamentous cyanobacterium CCP5]|nr:glycoside hydrolase [filamentous cyanobacterium CCP5]